MNDWFADWVELHCAATAADAKARVSLLANRTIFCETWQATAEELGTCTTRLVEKRRVPKFGNEHAEALGNELHHLRLERAESRRPDPAQETPIGEPPTGPDCAWCGDKGLVVVPMPKCVLQPRHAPPAICFAPGTRQVQTGVVLCDLPDCLAGRRVRDAEAKMDRRRMALTRYLRIHGSLNVCELLAEYEQGVVRECRRGAKGGGDVFGAVLAEAKRRVQERERAAA